MTAMSIIRSALLSHATALVDEGVDFENVQVSTT